MGKVGSSALDASLPSSAQLHSWSSELPVKYFSNRYYGSYLGRQRQAWRWWRAFERARLAYELQLRRGQKPKFIIGVREPVSRNISGFFQAMGDYAVSKSIAELEVEFYTHCAHGVPGFWFDVELRRHFDINIYDFPFNKNLGYQVLQLNSIDIFIYQFERLKEIENAIGDFTQTENFKLKRKNDSSDKKTGAVYNEFKNSFEPNPEYINWLRSGKYFHHFYG